MAANEYSPLEQLGDALEDGRLEPVRRLVGGLAPAETAHLVESLPPEQRAVLWQLIDPRREADVLQYLGDDLQEQYLRARSPDQLAAMLGGLDADDLADLLQRLPEQVTREVLAFMDHRDRHRVEQVLSYPEDSAGGLMNTDTITVRPNTTLDVVLRYLRRYRDIPDMTDALFVVNRTDEFIGLLPLRRLLVSDPNSTVRELMDTDLEPIRADQSAAEVATLFERLDWVSAPVVDQNGRLLGRITIDDVVDVIRESADHSLMSLAGLAEDEDTFAPVLKAVPRRALWLGVNLLTAFMAAGVINLFEDTIEKVVALAVLMPIVASMGGVAGTQTLTVVIRGMALGQIGRHNRGWLLSRELRVGLLNGLLWALVVAVAASFWFQDQRLGIIIGLALILNLVVAGLAGALLPLGLKKLRIDPALAGGVTLTTVTDVVGFATFLGLATWIYLT